MREETRSNARYFAHPFALVKRSRSATARASGHLLM
jgi:hypothetical protein